MPVASHRKLYRICIPLVLAAAYSIGISMRTCLIIDCKHENMSMRSGRRKARFACAGLGGTRMAPEWRRSQLDLHGRVGFTFTTSTFRFNQLQLLTLSSTLQFLHNGSQEQVFGPPTDLQRAQKPAHHHLAAQQDLHRAVSPHLNAYKTP